jgi:hypothetical protein
MRNGQPVSSRSVDVKKKFFCRTAEEIHEKAVYTENLIRLMT